MLDINNDIYIWHLYNMKIPIEARWFFYLWNGSDCQYISDIAARPNAVDNGTNS
jgi:hypothetical protein